MLLAIDASFLACALLDTTPVGAWALTELRARDEEELCAPSIVRAETLSVIRRKLGRNEITTVDAEKAWRVACDLPVWELPLQGWLATRVWELLPNLTPYDGWYVAVAEYVRAPLATLDARVVRATGPRCQFLVPE
jgi:predicted nucleic acid-binding protein